MPPVLCDYCESPYHDISTCPYRAACARPKKKIDDMTNQMIETMKLRIVEYSQCFNQIRKTYSEHDSRLGSPEPAVSLTADFAPSYSTRLDLNENMCLPSLEQESDLPKSLSTDLAPCTSSLEHVTDEQSDSDSELEISMIPTVEFHDSDDSKDVLQELHDVDMSLSKDSCVEYESFSIDLIQTDLLFESCKSDYIESENTTTEFE